MQDELIKTEEATNEAPTLGGGEVGVPAAKRAGKKKSLKKSLFNGLIYVLIVFGIVFGLPRVLTAALNTPYPMAVITSGSMWPALDEGDLVFIQGLDDPREVKEGDIIVFRNGERGNLTIHRIVRLKEKELVTKGDANFSEDAPISYEDIVGRTFNVGGKPLRFPYLGSVTVFASNLKNQ